MSPSIPIISEGPGVPSGLAEQWQQPENQRNADQSIAVSEDYKLAGEKECADVGSRVHRFASGRRAWRIYLSAGGSCDESRLDHCGQRRPSGGGLVRGFPGISARCCYHRIAKRWWWLVNTRSGCQRQGCGRESVCLLESGSVSTCERSAAAFLQGGINAQELVGHVEPVS